MRLYRNAFGDPPPPASRRLDPTSSRQAPFPVLSRRRASRGRAPRQTGPSTRGNFAEPPRRADARARSHTVRRGVPPAERKRQRADTQTRDRRTHGAGGTRLRPPSATAYISLAAARVSCPSRTTRPERTRTHTPPPPPPGQSLLRATSKCQALSVQMAPRAVVVSVLLLVASVSA